MRIASLAALTLCFSAFFSHLAKADDSTIDPNRLVVGVGIFNFMDSSDEQSYPTYRAELRLSEIPIWKVHPWVGVEYQTNDVQNVDINSYWAGAGLETDIDLYEDWLVLTLQTGVGMFDAGEDVPKGWQYLPNDGLEFRHQVELGARFHENWRAALALSHMSNAGITSNNNSINSLTFNVHVPLTFGKD